MRYSLSLRYVSNAAASPNRDGAFYKHVAGLERQRERVPLQLY